MIDKIDHIGIAVANLAESLAFYRDALGLEVSETEELTDMGLRVAFIPTGDTRLELLESTDPESAIGRFIESRGPGIHHIAFRVSGIEDRITELVEAGVRMVDNKPRGGAHGTRVAFLHPKSAGGVLYELVEEGE